jgi:hypothetical protein
MKGGLPIPIGPIGVLYSANLTPDRETGIGRYPDGQLFRLLRHNVKPNGHASLAPLMPFANMADNDLVAIVSYLRAQPPVRNEVPPAQWTLFGKAIVALVRPAAFQPVLGGSPPASAPEQAATHEESILPTRLPTAWPVIHRSTRPRESSPVRHSPAMRRVSRR